VDSVPNQDSTKPVIEPGSAPRAARVPAKPPAKTLAVVVRRRVSHHLLSDVCAVFPAAFDH
jgi:hypothetical protein